MTTQVLDVLKFSQVDSPILSGGRHYTIGLRHAAWSYQTRMPLAYIEAIGRWGFGLVESHDA
jgi:hypothetical protein